MAKVTFTKGACVTGYEDTADILTITSMSLVSADPRRVDYKKHDPADPANQVKDRVGYQEFPAADGWVMEIVEAI